MNMTRIRHILEMKRASRAPPLLPTNSKKRDKTLNQSYSKSVIHIDLEIESLNCEKLDRQHHITVLFSENGYEGSWQTVGESTLVINDYMYKIADICTIEYVFERQQHLKVNVYNNESVPILLWSNDFLVSEIICSKTALLRDVRCDPTGEPLFKVGIAYHIESSDPLIQLQFVGKNLAKKGKCDRIKFHFYVYQIDRGESSLIYQSEAAPYAPKIVWKQLILPRSLLDSNDRELKIVCYSQNTDARREIIGQFTTTLGIIEEGSQCSYVLSKGMARKDEKKPLPTFDVARCTETTVYSFLDYISIGLRLHVAVAIDFSTTSSNVAENETAMQNFADSVELSLVVILQLLSNYNSSKNFAAFGFGAKIPPLYRDSQQFCLKLETDAQCNGINGTVEAFRNAYKSVRSMSTAQFSHIIYYVSKLAEQTRKRYEQTSVVPYYILLIITRGSIDDLRETVQAIIFASKSPLSIIFVGVGENDFSQLEQLSNSGSRLAYSGRKAERDMSQFASLSAICNEQSDDDSFRELIAEQTLSQIPKQITFWMSKNGYIARCKKDQCQASQSNVRSAHESTGRSCTFTANVHGLQKSRAVDSSNKYASPRLSNRRTNLNQKLRSMSLSRID